MFFCNIHTFLLIYLPILETIDKDVLFGIPMKNIFIWYSNEKYFMLRYEVNLDICKKVWQSD